MEDCSSFYLIDSISVDETSIIGNGNAFDFNRIFKLPEKSKLDRLDMLTMQEELKVDSFSHHSMTGEVSFIYNRWLHLANIKSALFGGFDF
jgi:hypothetical protein